MHTLGHPVIYYLHILLDAVDIYSATYELKKVCGSEVLLGLLYYPEKQVRTYILQCGAVYVVLVGVIVVEDNNLDRYEIFEQQHML